MFFFTDEFVSDSPLGWIWFCVKLSLVLGEFGFWFSVKLVLVLGEVNFSSR